MGLVLNRRSCVQLFGLGGVVLHSGALLAQAPVNLNQTPRERLQQLVEDAGSDFLSKLIGELNQTKRFAAWLVASELTSELQGKPGLAVFVPVDEAWPDHLRSATPTREAARSFILRHVVYERWNAVGGASTSLTSPTGVRMTIDGINVNNVALELSGLRINNGYVHLIRGVL
jgi:uncharacterized surface protein with fasciclin (FAS1) repeats